MVPIAALWLPILLSAVAVFIASSLFWMVVRHHDSDWRGLPEEGAILDAFRRAKVPRGQYRFPYADSRQMQTPEMQKKLAEGPAGFLIYWDRYQGGMGKSMGQWLVYLLAVSLFVGYLTGRVQAPGAAFASVFRVAGTAAVLAYGAAHVPSSIWWGRSWSATLKDVFDGVVYGLLTAVLFGWLWPR